VAAANGNHRNVLVAGVAALFAGAMSMAAGEYVSVHSQADTEKADLDLERKELRKDDEGEHRELTGIYVARGLDPSLARQVAEQLMAHDALGAHARDELGISESLAERPVQAALSSAASFAVGAMLPLILTGAPLSKVQTKVETTVMLFCRLTKNSSLISMGADIQRHVLNAQGAPVAGAAVVVTTCQKEAWLIAWVRSASSPIPN
jgi:VIT1/CCC1 family predicted Fe2+/Mn2+ transporter